MKLLIAIVSNDDSSAVITALTKNKFQVTKLSTTGGFLRAGNTTLLMGVEDEKVEECISLIGSESCKRTEMVPATASFDIFRPSAFAIATSSFCSKIFTSILFILYFLPFIFVIIYFIRILALLLNIITVL